MDVGSGLGANSYAAAKSGAQVTALEPNSSSLQLSKELIVQYGSDIFQSIRFVNKTIEEFDDLNKFDFIVCDEAFEHLLDFPVALGKMAGLLRPNGRLVSGWGPIWHSPRGGHQLMLYAALHGSHKIVLSLTLKSLIRGSSRKQLIPYSHRLLTGYALKLHRESIGNLAINTIQDVGLNGYSSREFRVAIEQSPLDIITWHENQGDNLKYRVLRVLSKIPGAKNLFTSNVYAVLMRHTE